MKTRPCLTLTLLLSLLSAARLAAGTTAPTSPALESPDGFWNGDLSISLTAGYESLHVYRGADSSFGSQNLWQGLDIDFKDFLHFNLYHGSGTNSDYEELTPSGYIHHDFGPVDVALGVIWYHFPDYHSSDSTEYYVRLSHTWKNGISAWLHAGYNQDAEGWYEELGIRYSRELTEKLSIAPYVSVGTSQNYRSTGEDGFDNLTLGLTTPYQLTQQVTVTPAVGLALPLDTFDGANELWGALTVTVKF